jgi:hypothetical protein
MCRALLSVRGSAAQARADGSPEDAREEGQELARVHEWLGWPGLMPGIARALHKHVAIPECEIAELEQAR